MTFCTVQEEEKQEETNKAHMNGQWPWPAPPVIDPPKVTIAWAMTSVEDWNAQSVVAADGTLMIEA